MRYFYFCALCCQTDPFVLFFLQSFIVTNIETNVVPQVIKSRQNILAIKIWNKNSTNEQKHFCSFSPFIGRQFQLFVGCHGHPLSTKHANKCKAVKTKLNLFRMNLHIHFLLSHCTVLWQRVEMLFLSFFHLNSAIFSSMAISDNEISFQCPTEGCK